MNLVFFIVIITIVIVLVWVLLVYVLFCFVLFIVGVFVLRLLFGGFSFVVWLCCWVFVWVFAIWVGVLFWLVCGCSLLIWVDVFVECCLCLILFCVWFVWVGLF